MIGKTDSQKPLPETSSRNVSKAPNAVKPSVSNDAKLSAAVSKSQAAPASKTSLPSSSQAVPRSALSLVTAAGLPSDKLSSSVVTFARFFSLPLKPQLLADIRRQAVMTSAQMTSGQMTDTKCREVLSLCAAAAESKGAELLNRGLESYAEAVDPDLRRRNDEERRERRKRDNSENTDEKKETKAVSVNSENIKQTVLECLEKNPLLEILNRLPGKNGQRWIVLPFDFSQGEIEYKVSMRILIDDRRSRAGQSENSVSCLALDISEKIKKENVNSNFQITDNRKLFAFQAAAGKPVRLSVYLNPELPQKAHHQYIKKISKLMDIPPDCININKFEESFPFEENYGQKFSLVNEEA